MLPYDGGLGDPERDGALVVRPMAVAGALRAGASLARTLHALHERRRVHGAVHPPLVILGHDGALQLLDRSDRGRGPGVPDFAAAAGWLAPEQTGRVDRALDARTDLYGLGAVLYALLTGHPPFVGDDPAAVVHGVLAAQPTPVDERRPDVPAPVAALVHKLLSKVPADRYQSAAGAVADLARCLAELEDSGTVRPFVLGTHDAVRTLPPPRELHGRDGEAAHLVAALDLACGGSTRLVCVTGAPGVGKTVVARALLDRAVDRDCLVGGGKAEQRHPRPFGVFASAFDDLFQRVLLRPEESIARIRADLAEALGGLAGVVTAIVPDAAHLVRAAARFGEAAAGDGQDRVVVAFQRLLDALATEETPVVLLLDDLQWADPASLELLERCLLDGSRRALLVLAAWRDGEVGHSHPLRAALDRLVGGGLEPTKLTLSPLEPAAVRDLLADVLSAGRAEVGSLAGEVAVASGGNPLFALALLGTLLERGLLRRERVTDRWRWEAHAVTSVGVADDVADLLAQHLARLPAAQRELLTTAAALGGGFPTTALERASRRPAGDVRATLETAVTERLLVPLDAGGRWRFAHDRIEAAAYALLPDGARAARHREIGFALLASADPNDDETLVLAANQLHLGRAALVGDDERRRAAELYARAAERARGTGAAADARAWFERALAVLPDGSGASDRDFRFRLELGRARCLYVCGDFDAAHAAFRDLATRAPDDERAADAHCARAVVFQNQGRGAEAVAEGLAALRRLGLPSPETDDEFREAADRETALVRAALAARDVASLLHEPAMVDPSSRLEIRILAAFAPSTYNFPERFRYLSMRMTALTLRHGTAPETPLGYALAGLVLGFYGDGATAHGLSEVAFALADGSADAQVLAHVALVHGAFVKHWFDPWQDCVSILERGYGAALAAGSLTYAGWLGMNLALVPLSGGAPLPDVRPTIERHLDATLRLLRYEDIADVLRALAYLVAALAGDEERREALAREGRSLSDIRGRMGHYPGAEAYLQSMEILFHTVLGEVEEAIALGRSFDERQMAVAGQGSPTVAAKSQFHALALTAALRDTRRPDARDLRARLDEEVVRLERWAAAGPANHRAFYLLVTAERAALDGDDASALDGYDAAIQEARERGAHHALALGCERAAAFHEARGRSGFASLYRLDAWRAWMSWGAEVPARRLAERDPALARHAARGGESSLGTAIDTAALVKAAQAVGAEVDLRTVATRLLATALENAGAERGVLLLMRDGVLHLVARGTAARGAEALEDERALEPDDRVPLAVVRTVCRTRRTVRLADAANERPFCEDPDVRSLAPRSVLCVPLELRGELVGVLHLENNLNPGAFTPSRASFLRLLGALAATSLEDARLNEQLTRTTEALRTSRDRLEEVNRTLEARVADRTRAIERLHRHHDRILESLAEGVVCVDRDGLVTYANEAVARLTGWTAANLIGRSLHARVHAVGVGGAPGEAVECPLCRGAAVEVAPREETFLRADGGTLPVECGARPLLDEDGALLGAVVTFRDLTDRRRLQSQLRRSQELQAVGQFAGGLAHQLNNLLTPILSNLSLALQEIPLDEEQLRGLTDAEQAAWRAADLVRRLLAFGRRGGVFREAVPLSAVVDDVVRFVRSSVGSEIAVGWEPPAIPVRVFVDRAQIEQLLVNLCVNAREALLAADPADAVVDRPIGIHVAVAGEPPVALAGRDVPSGWITVAVSDDGPGMPPEIASRVFEPFFTTRSATGHVGLGLTLAHGIVEQHGGVIACESMPGQGTTFTCWLPIADVGPSAEAPAHGVAPVAGTGPRPDAGRGSRGRATILVVDDEPLVRSLARSILGRLGHAVVMAGDGVEALERFRERADEIDLVLLDLTMPRMNGRRTLAALRELRQDVRVVLWSGYAVGEDDLSAHALGARAFLPKPFSPDQLRAMVARILAQP